jgi:hypothetical protein
MAAIVTLDRNNALADEAAIHLEMIRDGLAFFVKRDGMRAQTISVSPEYFGTVFGVTSNQQAMSDRWGAIAAGTYTGLKDFLDATVAE